MIFYELFRLENWRNVLQKWKKDFQSLYNRPIIHTDIQLDTDNLMAEASGGAENPTLDDNISILEIQKAIYNAKRNKSPGFDEIPSEIMRNDAAVSFLHILFNVRFISGFVPSDWGKGIIHPIPKSSTADPRDLLSYRGISLASSMYKLYCHVLNERLSKWVETHNIILDNQNGFRKQHSTVDHIMSLTSIIETRKRNKLPTYCAFIDFKKAYDYVDRKILWERLQRVGVSGRMLSAVKSLYSNITACVRINGMCTDWFTVSTGLRQGYTLSPILFNLFIDDLAVQLQAVGKGIVINDEAISILLYADDVVLLAENEDDLQHMLNILSQWCNRNNMIVNCSKSNIVHFRPN